MASKEKQAIVVDHVHSKREVVGNSRQKPEVTGSRNPQRYLLIQAFFTNLCCNEQMVISQ